MTLKGPRRPNEAPPHEDLEPWDNPIDAHPSGALANANLYLICNPLGSASPNACCCSSSSS